MSGGFFEYKDYVLDDIADRVIGINAEVNGLGLDNRTGEDDFSYYNLIEDKETFNKVCRNAIAHLKLAKVYVHRLDWMLSGDDSEDSFKQRLKEDLEDLQKKGYK